MRKQTSRNMRYVILSVWFTALMCGCAGYSIRKNGTGRGYDVYKPEPYLLVTQGDKGPKGAIVWLPNYEERYRITTWNFLGKADFQFDMTDGWQLTRISDRGDNSDVASKLMDVVQKGIPSRTISLTGGVQLYRLIYTHGVVTGMKQILVEEADE